MHRATVTVVRCTQFSVLPPQPTQTKGKPLSVIALVAHVAAAQHGVVHRRQLLDAGSSRRMIECAVASGDLVRIATEVYRAPGAPITWRQRLMTAVLDAGPGACVSHRPAAVLLGIADRRAAELVEISTPSNRTARLEGVLVHRHKDLSPDHVMLVDGIPCAGYLRTLVDLGAVEPEWVVRDAFERALTMRVITLPAAEWIITELSRRGRNGVGVFRHVVDQHVLGMRAPDSILEPRAMRIFRKYGLPTPTFQYELRTPAGLFVARFDFAYPSIKEAFEVNGWEHHSTPQQVTAGYAREHGARRLGWGITNFSYWHVVKDERYVAATVTDVLRARSHSDCG